MRLRRAAAFADRLARIVAFQRAASVRPAFGDQRLLHGIAIVEASAFSQFIGAGARRLKALDEENRKLKKLLAEAMLDVATLREALGKNF